MPEPQEQTRTLEDAVPQSPPSVEATAAGGPLFAGAEKRYRPRHLHAKGGLGEVHVADDLQLGRIVALKRLQDSHVSRPASLSRFLREAEITARLEHPGIVPVYGLVRDAQGHALR